MALLCALSVKQFFRRRPDCPAEWIVSQATEGSIDRDGGLAEWIGSQATEGVVR